LGSGELGLNIDLIMLEALRKRFPSYGLREEVSMMEDDGRFTAITMSCSYRSRLIGSLRFRGLRCPSSCGLLRSLRLSTGLRLAISHD